VPKPPPTRKPVHLIRWMARWRVAYVAACGLKIEREDRKDTVLTDDPALATCRACKAAADKSAFAGST